jgi:hypothetical protein
MLSLVVMDEIMKGFNPLYREIHIGGRYLMYEGSG